MTAGQPARVLLTLDCGTVDADALKVLRFVVGERDVELVGLYIEDEDLYSAARLPGMPEVSITGAVSVLDSVRIGADMAGQVRLARRELEASARRLQLKCSFQVLRGRTAQTLVEAAVGTDCVVVTRSLRAPGLRSRRGDEFGPLVARQNNLLFVNEPWSSGRSVVVLSHAQPEADDRALQAARRIAKAEALDLIVAVPRAAVDRPHPARVAGEAREVELYEWTEDAIVDLCGVEDARLLVLAAGVDLDWRALLPRLIDRLSCSLLRLD